MSDKYPPGTGLTADQAACATEHKLPRYVPRTGYDPTHFGRAIERSVSDGERRLYSSFSVSPNFGGCVKAYAVGCDLRCGFCWSPVRSRAEILRVERSSNEIEQALIQGLGGSHDALVSLPLDVRQAVNRISTRFYSPREVVDKLLDTYRSGTIAGIGEFELLTEGDAPEECRYFTVTGGEPTLCKEHLLAVLAEFTRRELPVRFLLQTHGLNLGADPDYIEQLIRFRDQLEVRISLKAGTPQAMKARTGVIPDAFELPFHAIDRLLALGLSFHLAAMTDPQVMPAPERTALMTRLISVCQRHGKQLRPIEGEAGGRELDMAGRAVFIDEECYEEVYPHILARVT